MSVYVRIISTHAVHSTIFFMSEVLLLILDGKYRCCVVHHHNSMRPFGWRLFLYLFSYLFLAHGLKKAAIKWTIIHGLDFDALCEWVPLHGIISLLFIASAELWFAHFVTYNMVYGTCHCNKLCFMYTHFCIHSLWRLLSLSFILISLPFSRLFRFCWLCFPWCNAIHSENVHGNHYDSMNIKLDYVVYSWW